MRDTQPSPRTPPEMFVRQAIANGLKLSTCLLCHRTFASPKPAALHLAETLHRCTAGNSLKLRVAS